MNSQIVDNKNTRQGQEKILGFPKGKFESLGDFSLGVGMGDEEPVNLWNSLMRLVHCYDTILDIDQDIDEELREELRLRVAEIDKEIEELRERHNGVMV